MLLAITSLINVVSAGIFGHHTHPVCIIGAGPSGLTVASELQSKNIPYKIFEKEGFVGGKAQNYVDPSTGDTYFLGPVIMSTSSHFELVDMVKKLNVTMLPYPNHPAFNAYEWRTGVAKTVPRPTPSDKEVAAMHKYLELYKRYEEYLVPGYTNGIPFELKFPFYDFLYDNHIDILAHYFWEPMTAFGYGSLDSTPAIYALRLITPVLIQYIFDVPGFEDSIKMVNFQDLFAKFAATLKKDDIILNAKVLDIRRGDGDENHLSYSVDGRKYVQKCMATVMAFPPRLDRLEEIMTLAWEEKELFFKVRTIGYHSGVAKASRMDAENRYINFIQFNQTANPPFYIGSPQLNGQVVEAHHYPNQTPMTTFYSWSLSRANSDDVRKLALETLSRLNRPVASAVNESVPLAEDDIKVFKSWDYFPHVGPLALDDGFYRTLNGLQGFLNTYWISGLNSFESVGNVVATAKAFVDDYF